MKKYTWNFEEHAEYWSNDAFDTVEECINDAMAIAKSDCEKPEFVYIGECVAFVPRVDAECVMEQIADGAFEFCEIAEDWDCYDHRKTNELEELSEQLTMVVQAWLKKYNREPDFYRMENIKRYRLEVEPL